MALILYIFAKTPLHVYLIEFIFGVAGAISYPAWMGLFSRNLEGGRESFLWGLHSTITELTWAATAALGGFLAESFGFGSLFLTAGIIAVVGSFILFVVYEEIAKPG